MHLTMPSTHDQQLDDSRVASVPMAPAMDDIVRLCKHRGFIFPSAEIYGGFRSTYDYGPLGVLMLRNVKDAWWRSMVQLRHEVVGLDAAILSSPKIWEASGHLASFTDPLVDCRNCKERWRADHLEPDPKDGLHPLPKLRQHRPDRRPGLQPDVQDLRRPGRGRGQRRLPAARDGPGPLRQLPQRAADVAQAAAVRDRPDRQVVSQRDHARELRVPHPGVRADGARILRAARGARTPGSSTGATSGWSGTSTSASPGTCCACGRTRRRSCLTTRPATSDVEFLFPWGWGELEGIANRTDFDLKAHSRASGAAAGVLRPGHQRALLPVRHRAGRGRHPHHDGVPAGRLRRATRSAARPAPSSASIPAWRRTRWPCCPCRARTPWCRWRGRCWTCCQPITMCDYDETQSIGRRYRRQDEIGTPLAVTIDFDSLEDHAVTIRDRDTTEQVRVPIANAGRRGHEPARRHRPQADS